jgi:hypothetical protein
MLIIRQNDKQKKGAEAPFLLAIATDHYARLALANSQLTNDQKPFR